MHKVGNELERYAGSAIPILRVGSAAECVLDKELGDDLNYYRACAVEMMAKAQAAPSKAVRRAYLNLALNWLQEAVFLGKTEENSEADRPHKDHNPWLGPAQNN